MYLRAPVELSNGQVIWSEGCADNRSATALIFPAFREARGIRRQNIAIRLLEAPLRMAKTSEEAANAINKAFEQVFIQANGR